MSPSTLDHPACRTVRNAFSLDRHHRQHTNHSRARDANSWKAMKGHLSPLLPPLVPDPSAQTEPSQACSLGSGEGGGESRAKSRSCGLQDPLGQVLYVHALSCPRQGMAPQDHQAAPGQLLRAREGWDANLATALCFCNCPTAAFQGVCTS